MNRHEEFTVGERPAASIEIRSGTLEVRTGGQGRISIALDGPDVDQWQVAQFGDSVSVEPPSRGGWRSRSTRVLVDVPSGTDIDVRSASADVSLSGEFGATRIKSASGDVRVGSVTRLDVNTASGDATATAVAAVTSCTTASGDVELGRVGGRLTVSTASGDVRVADADDDVEIGSTSGDVRVDRCSGSNVMVKSISGDVIVGLPPGIRVEPDITTLSGRTQLPTPVPSTGTEPRRVVRVGLKTVSGDITIRRVDAR
jgi:DUF4097 and DUF4098 domain-containing protein YvlB